MGWCAKFLSEKEMLDKLKLVNAQLEVFDLVWHSQLREGCLAFNNGKNPCSSQS